MQPVLKTTAYAARNTPFRAVFYASPVIPSERLPSVISTERSERRNLKARQQKGIIKQLFRNEAAPAKGKWLARQAERVLFKVIFPHMPKLRDLSTAHAYACSAQDDISWLCQTSPSYQDDGAWGLQGTSFPPFRPDGRGRTRMFFARKKRQNYSTEGAQGDARKKFTKKSV